MDIFEDEDPLFIENFKFFYIHGKVHQNEVHLKGKLALNNIYKTCIVVVKPITRTIYVKPKVAIIFPEIVNAEIKYLFKDAPFTSTVVNVKTIYNTLELLYKVQFTENVSICNMLLPEHIEYVYGLEQNALDQFLMDKQIMGPSWLDITVLTATKYITCPSSLVIRPEDISLNVADSALPMSIPPLEAMVFDLIPIINRKDTVEPFCITVVKGEFSNGKFSCKQPPRLFVQMMVFAYITERGAYIELKDMMKAQKSLGWLNDFWQYFENEEVDIIICQDLHKIQRVNNFFYTQIQRDLVLDLKQAADEFYSADMPNNVPSLVQTFFQEDLDTPREYHKVYNFVQAPEGILLAFRNFIGGVREKTNRIFFLANEMAAFPAYISLSKASGYPLKEIMLKSGQHDRVESILKFALRSKYQCPDLNVIIPELHSPDRPRKIYVKGGLVLEPSLGLFQRFVLGFDFKSLYPSIIREYNLAFADGDNSLVNVMENLMKLRDQYDTHEGDSDAERRIKKIHRSAIKLLANSIYGCISSEHSNFYHPELANCITRHGRALLSRAEFVTKHEFQCQLIFGFTDSLFIYLSDENYKTIYEKAMIFANKFNSQYKHVKLVLEGVYAKALIINKHVYALRHCEESNANEDPWIIKGLITSMTPMVYNKVCLHFFNTILEKTTDCDTVTNEIINVTHQLLTSKDIEDYKMSIRLTKHIMEDQEKQSSKLVQRVNKNFINKYQRFDYISYVICNNSILPEGSKSHGMYTCEEFKNLNPQTLTICLLFYRFKIYNLFKIISNAIPQVINIDYMYKKLNLSAGFTLLHDLPEYLLKFVSKELKIFNFHFRCLKCQYCIVLNKIKLETFFVCESCSSSLCNEEQMESITLQIINKAKAFPKKLEQLRIEESALDPEERIDNCKREKYKFFWEYTIWKDEIQHAWFVIEYSLDKTKFINDRAKVQRFLLELYELILNSIRDAGMTDKLSTKLFDPKCFD